MTRYHAHPNGYLTIDDDPTPVVEAIRIDHPIWPAPDYAAIRNTRRRILSELASGDDMVAAVEVHR